MLVSACVALATATATAATFDLPKDGSTVVGSVQIIVPRPDNTLLDIMRHFDLGYDEITLANPNVDVWTPHEFTQVIIPTQFILPPKPWTGIVVNIPQRRLYYFPVPAKGQPAQVITYPISIAREGWSTPLGSTKITAKYKDPSWFPPESIRNEHRVERGEELPEYVPPGPDNPMGMLAMRTGFPGIFIHATNKPWGLGMRTSHGCMHLYPENAAELFGVLAIGTPVRIINQPVMVGNDHGRLVMSVFEPVAEYPDSPTLEQFADRELAPIRAAQQEHPSPADDIDESRVAQLLETPQSVPVALSKAKLGLAAWLDMIPPDRYDFAPYGSEANNAMMPGARASGAAPDAVATDGSAPAPAVDSGSVANSP